MAERFTEYYLGSRKVHRLLPAKLKIYWGAPNQILHYQCG